jgi:hypothetical protein
MTISFRGRCLGFLREAIRLRVFHPISAWLIRLASWGDEVNITHFV